MRMSEEKEYRHTKLFLCTSVEYGPSDVCGGRNGCQTLPNKIIVDLTIISSVSNTASKLSTRSKYKLN